MVDLQGNPGPGNPIGGDAVRMVGYGTLALTAGAGGLSVANALSGGARALEAAATRQYLSSINLVDLVGAEAKIVMNVVTGRASIELLSMETRTTAAAWFRAIQLGGKYEEAAAVEFHPELTP
jgi:hypothetical protein